MLAKVGNMQYRRDDIAGARATLTRMDVKRPDTSAMGKAKRAQEEKRIGPSAARKSRRPAKITIYRAHRGRPEKDDKQETKDSR